MCLLDQSWALIQEHEHEQKNQVTRAPKQKENPRLGLTSSAEYTKSDFDCGKSYASKMILPASVPGHP